MSNFALIGSTAGIIVGLAVGWVLTVAGSATQADSGVLSDFLGLVILAGVTWAAFYVGTLL